MVMGNALLFKHLGRDWKWSADGQPLMNPTYIRILRMFLDRKDSEYSLHMIAHQGADFGRPIGQWFGPNNVAQALKKLSTHDLWSKLAVHVALDMVVVVDDIKELCRQPHQTPREVPVELAEWEKRRSQTTPNVSLPPSLLDGPQGDAPESGGHSDEPLRRQPHTTSGAEGTRHEVRRAGKKGLMNGTERPKRSPFHRLAGRRRGKKETFIRSADFDRVGQKDSSSSDEGDDDCFPDEVGGAKGSEFRSLLLFIPLRLGQEKFNLEYKEAVKACLSLPQSVGIIGGKPRHALYFIGHHGDNLLYLDPHTTQSSVSCSDTSGMVPDHSYHCSQPDRMNVSELDPSVALAFFCRDESDFDDLCGGLRESVLTKMKYMFELTEKRPSYWGPVERNPHNSVHEPFLLVNQAPPSPKYTCAEDSDGFEVIDYA
jgi:hypothetical protein